VAVWNVYREAAAGLAAAGVPAIVTRGLALAGTVYPHPSLRHCHDLDLLVPGDALERGARVLVAAGYSPAAGADGAGPDAVLVHRSGFPVCLHSRPFQPRRSGERPQGLWARSRLVPLGGGEARVLSPSDTLLHALGHAAHSPSRLSLVWVADAWWIIRRDAGLDWELLVREAMLRRLTLPLAVMLTYLADELAVPVPAAVLATLAAAATDTLDREVAVQGASAGGTASAVRLLRDAPDWPTRGRIAWWLLAPTPRYLREVGTLREQERVLPYYLARLWAAGRRAAAGRLGQR
jgi:hypothetical protein